MIARFTYKKALITLGLKKDFPIHTQDGYDNAIAAWKELTVAARNANDDDKAALLSQCKEVIKKRFEYTTSRMCPKCGRGKSTKSAYCQMCSLIVRNGDTAERKMLETYEIESTVYIPEPARQYGKFTKSLIALGNGNIGDSFETTRSCGIHSAAALLGGKVICRLTNPNETDPKKRMTRVWRSDGLSMDQVNAILKRRLSGEIVEKPPAWVPPTG